MIVYFTATGNSLYCARVLADALGDELTDSFHFIRDGIAAELRSDKPWIFVSPTYAWRLPRIFSDFIRSGSFSGSKDVYFVMTCGDDNGNAAEMNRALCEEKSLTCRGTLPVIMPENYITMYKAPGPDESQKIIQAALPTLERGIALIREGRELPTPHASVSGRLRSGAVNPAFYRFVVGARRFRASDACIGCGKCVRGCVLHNIELRDGKPVWGKRCTHCMACICLCPTAAVEYGRATVGRVRYRFPGYGK